jgi:hypothetical protein
MGEIRREPTVKYYKECIRAGVPTSRQEKVQKIGAFSAYAETPISSAWNLKICPSRDAKRLALSRGFVFIETLFGTELL